MGGGLLGKALVSGLFGSFDSVVACWSWVNSRALLIEGVLWSRSWLRWVLLIGGVWK